MNVGFKAARMPRHQGLQTVTATLALNLQSDIIHRADDVYRSIGTDYKGVHRPVLQRNEDKVD